MKTQLLCTFTTKGELQNTLQLIRETYHIVYNYIYILQNKANLDELFITYNIDTAFQPDTPLENTIKKIQTRVFEVIDFGEGKEVITEEHK